MRLLVSFVLLAACASVAAAESYVSLGIGGDAALHGDVGDAANGSQGGNGRLALGLGVGRLSVEGSLSRFGLDGSSATAAGVHLRLRFPIEGGFGAYGRAGLEHLWFGDDRMTLLSTGANGVVGGLGLEYRLSAPLLGQAGLWAEVSQDRFGTGGGTGGVRLWTAGLTIGL